MLGQSTILRQATHLTIVGVAATTFAAAGRLPDVLYRVFGLSNELYKPFPLSSYAVLAMTIGAVIYINNVWG